MNAGSRALMRQGIRGNGISSIDPGSLKKPIDLPPLQPSSSPTEELVDGKIVAFLDGLVNTLLPLAKPILDDLLELEAPKRSGQLALWGLQAAGAPLPLISDVRTWLQHPPKGQRVMSARGVDSFRRVEKETVTPPPVTMVTPPETQRAHSGGTPKSRGGSPPTFKAEPTSLVQAEQAIFSSMVPRRPPPARRQNSTESSRSNGSRTSLFRAESVASNSPAGIGTMSRMLSEPANHGGRRFSRRNLLTMTTVAGTDVDAPPKDKLLGLLRKVPAFSRYTDTELAQVAQKARCRMFNPDDPIVQWGGPSDTLHIIVDGTSQVSVPHHVAILRPGDFIGEEAFSLVMCTNDKQVSAAGGPVTTVSLSREDLHTAMLQHKQSWDRHRHKVLHNHEREAAPGESQKTGICIETGRQVVQPGCADDTDREGIVEAIKSSKMLGDVLQLSDAEHHLIAETVYLISLSKGEVLFKAGDRGKAMFIVHSGVLSVTASTEADGEEGHHSFKMRAGDICGDLGLLYGAPNPSTVVALQDSLVWVLTHTDFQFLRRVAYQDRLKAYASYTMRVPCLHRLVDAEHHDLLAELLEELTVEDGGHVCTEGQDQGLLFIVHKGECSVWQNGKEEQTLHEGDWIGERQLEEGMPSDATVIARSKTVQLLVLEKYAFDTMLKTISDMPESLCDRGKRDTIVKRADSGKADQQNAEPLVDVELIEKGRFAEEHIQQLFLCRQNSPGLHPPNFGNMVKMGALGEGGFGSVFLLKEQRRNKPYALKVVAKDQLMEEKMLPAMRNERIIMGMLESRFIVTLYMAFHNATHVFLLMEAVLGGELYELYQDLNLFGQFNVVRFHIACVIQGLQDMHLVRVVYRDLKLENCLCDIRGYVKLTDFGIAKVVVGKTYTVCGTSDYFAPETLKQSGHNRAVDWWACGVLLFIMATGFSPFDAPDQSQIFKNIMRGFAKVKFPKGLPAELVAVVMSLCCKTPEDRIPMRKGGVEALKQMLFFSQMLGEDDRGFSWQDLQWQQAEPPFKPPEPDMAKISQRKLERDMDLPCLAELQEWDGSQLDG